MRISDVMTTNVHTVDALESLAGARKAMQDRGIHHLVVVRDGRVAGLVTSELLDWGEAESIARVEDVMFRHVASGTPDLTVRQAADLLRGRAAGALPIFDGDRLAGIVTVSDLLDLLGRCDVADAQRSRRRTPRQRRRKAAVS